MSHDKPLCVYALYLKVFNVLVIENLNFWITDFKGEIAALGAAILWAISSIIYSRLGQRIPPLKLNLFKGAIAITLLVLTLFLRNDFLPSIAPVPLCLLLLSGVVGIGIGDTAFFAALNCLGPRRALLMETLAPPMTAIGALIFLQEQLSVGAWCGLLLTILGVAWVVTERIPNSSTHSVNLARGISFGLLAALAMATGGILSRAVLANTTISPLWAALLRLIAAVLVLLPSIWLKAKRQEAIPPAPLPKGGGKRQEAIKLEKYSRIKIYRLFPLITAIFCAAFAGTYLGIWLQQTAIKFTAAGIALTLTNTSPLFVLPLAIYLGEKVSFRAIAGAVIAISGIAVLFYLR